jgi:Ni/Co efflux regulator RcnB
MKSTALVCALAAAALGFGSLAYAQGYDRGQGRDGRPAQGAREGGGQRQWHDGGQSRQRQSEHRGRVDQHRQSPPPAQWGQQRHEAYRAQPPQGYGRQGIPPGGYVQAVPPQRHSGQPGPQHGSQVQPQWQGRHDARRSQDRDWRGQAPRFRSGDYLPPEYRQRHYYVNDWRAHRLYAPPAGHQWVQVDTGDYLLIALTTGIIANLLLGQ